jgi:DNA-binding IclR family transcriptional regulator
MTRETVKSAARAFEILEFFARTRRPARLRDIVQQLDYPTSSVNSILKSMVTQGYMSFDPDTHCYMPAARLAHLTTWINSGGFEQTVVLEAMYQLRALAGEPVVMATPNDIFLEYVETLHRSEGINSHIKPGTRRLLAQTGTGWLFLSRMSRADALSVYHRTIAANELTTREFSEATFLEKLDEHSGLDVSFIRAKDLLRPTAHWDAAMISMIIPTPPQHRPLALGAHGPVQRLEAKRDMIAAELRAIARSIGNSITPTVEELPLSQQV